MGYRLGCTISTQGFLPPVQGYEAKPFVLTSLMLWRRVECVQSILRLLGWPTSDETKHLCMLLHSIFWNQRSLIVLRKMCWRANVDGFHITYQFVGQSATPYPSPLLGKWLIRIFGIFRNKFHILSFAFWESACIITRWVVDIWHQDDFNLIRHISLSNRDGEYLNASVWSMLGQLIP